ncbi:MAG: transcription termination factor Rho [Deltaproteobacteria bacterium]|nr:transcription termination factor Rho [Deltaproteobacteria bacterium]
MDSVLLDLRSRSTADLVQAAERFGIERPTSLSRQELVFQVLTHSLERGAMFRGEGVLETLPDGFGFLRTAAASYLPGADDIYVSPSQIRRFHLRTGDVVEGRVRSPKETERYLALYKVERVNGIDPEVRPRPIVFEHLPALPPDRPLHLGRGGPGGRMLDRFAPVGLGDRALVLAPPRTGATSLLLEVARGMRLGQPEIVRVFLLIGARPEEVSEIREAADSEVVATTFDEDASRHVQAADITIERVRRLAEAGRSVVLLVDSLTSLARASGELNGELGQDLSPSALTRPRRLLATARRLEGAGAVTVVAAVTTHPQSRLDDALADAFRPTAGTEIVLNEGIARAGLFPSIDLLQTVTPRLGRFLDPAAARAVASARAALPSDPLAALETSLADLEGSGELRGEHATGAARG